MNEKKSTDAAERRIRLHLAPFVGNTKASKVTTEKLGRYVEHRRRQGAKNATINPEVAILRRGFNLGHATMAPKVLHVPKFPSLQERNIRTGFFEEHQFTGLLSHLPAALHGIVRFAFVTGWRKQEILTLTWRQVDMKRGRVRLEPGTTKNGEGRVFPITERLRAVLEEQRAYTDRVQRERGELIPWVFHRQGKPIHNLRKSWATACREAGVPGMVLHDFRRTAVRNLVRASIPERVAMSMTGHKTRSVFERYNIVSEGDLTEAAAKLDRADSGNLSKSVSKW